MVLFGDTAVDREPSLRCSKSSPTPAGFGRISMTTVLGVFYCFSMFLSISTSIDGVSARFGRQPNIAAMRVRSPVRRKLVRYRSPPHGHVKLADLSSPARRHSDALTSVSPRPCNLLSRPQISRAPSSILRLRRPFIGAQVARARLRVSAHRSGDSARLPQMSGTKSGRIARRAASISTSRR